MTQDGAVDSLRQGGWSVLECGSPGGTSDGGMLLDPLNTPVYLSPKLITTLPGVCAGSI